MENTSNEQNDFIEATMSSSLGDTSSRGESKLEQLLDFKIAQGKTPGILKHLKTIEEASAVIASEIDKISLAEAQLKKDLGNSTKITVNRLSTKNWKVVTDKLTSLEQGQITMDMADIALKLFNS